MQSPEIMMFPREKIMIRSVFQRHTSVLLGVAVFLALTSTVHAAPRSGTEGNAIKLGLIIPLSGGYSSYGEQSLAGFKYIVNKINASGGIDSFGGSPIELVIVNSASSPAKAASAARQLASQAGICMLAGTILTNVMAAVSPIATRAQIPVLSFVAGGTNSEYLYSLGSSYGRGYAQSFVEMIQYLNEKESLNIETAAIMYSNYEAGQAVAEELKERLPQVGVEVIGAIPFDLNAIDYKAELTKLNAMNPDIVVGLVTRHAGIVLNNARYAVGSDLLFLGLASAFTSETVWDALGDAAAKEVLAENTLGSGVFVANPTRQDVQELLANAKSVDVGVPIGQLFIQGAQAARVIQRILETTGNCKTDHIVHALDTIVIPPNSKYFYLANTTGINFDPETRMLTDQSRLLMQMNKDGTREVVWPEEFATADLDIDR